MSTASFRHPVTPWILVSGGREMNKRSRSRNSNVDVSAHSFAHRLEADEPNRQILNLCIRVLQRPRVVKGARTPAYYLLFLCVFTDREALPKLQAGVASCIPPPTPPMLACDCRFLPVISALMQGTNFPHQHAVSIFRLASSGYLRQPVFGLSYKAAEHLRLTFQSCGKLTGCIIEHAFPAFCVPAFIMCSPQRFRCRLKLQSPR